MTPDQAGPTTPEFGEVRFVRREPLHVMYVAGDPDQPIPAQSSSTFRALESHISTLRSRRLLGVVVGNEYRACTSITRADRRGNLPLPLWTVPGGIYARIRIEPWQQNSDQIGHAFAALEQMVAVDPNRYEIELYRSHTQLDVLMPVTARRPLTAG